MRILFCLLLILCVLNGRNADPKISDNNETKVQVNDITSNVCGYEDDEIKTYLDNFLNFALNLFLVITEETNANFIYSPYSTLLSMSAIAEGSENRKSIDNVFGFPKDRCVKQRFYQIILSKIKPDLDVTFLKTQVLVIDERSHVKPNWHAYVPGQFQQNIIVAPIKIIPVSAAYAIRQITNVQLQGLNFTGNSVLLDSMEYTGLWQKTFPELLLKQPFFNNDGDQVGWVDMMKTKIRAKIAYNKEANFKAIELPVGIDGRYRMVIAQFIEKKGDFIKMVRALDRNFIQILKDNFKETRIPVEVQIPRFNLDTELDMRKILEKMGVNSLWRDPSVTRHIADPPVLPSSYIQRTNVFIDTAGAHLPAIDLVLDKSDTGETGLDPVLGRNFIANKPIYFGLFDTERYIPIIFGSYEVPTYSL